MPTDRVALTFGALAEPIHVQLGLPKRAVASFQRDADAITRLAVRGVLSSSEVASARRRLVRQIARAIAHADLERQVLQAVEQTAAEDGRCPTCGAQGPGGTTNVTRGDTDA